MSGHVALSFIPMDYSRDFHLPHGQLCTLSSLGKPTKPRLHVLLPKEPLLQKEASRVSMNEARSV